MTDGERFAICAATFYEDLAAKLIAGAREGFEAGGVEADAIDVHEVPGAFELPLAAKLCVEEGGYSGVACVGAVIRGETDHYDYVCAEAARGIQEVQLRTGVPCAFGVITCDTMDQALARAGGERRNQGRHAAEAVLAMHSLRRSLG